MGVASKVHSNFETCLFNPVLTELLHSRSGFKIIATCSPHNFDLVKSRGADYSFDYHEMDKCVKNVRELVRDDCCYAFNCVDGATGPQVCSCMTASFGTV